MKAKLVKTGQDYILYSESKETLAISNGRMVGRVLSKENCQAIERGYDLFELAYDSSKEFLIESTHSPSFTFGYEQGFQKALEILGDKKFSETELYRAFLINSAGDDFTLNQFFNNTVLPMFQQTEWDVEIEMFTSDDLKSVEDDWVKLNKPKLDADGCLILKRI